MNALSTPTNLDRRSIWMFAGRVAAAVVGLVLFLVGLDLALGLYDLAGGPRSGFGNFTEPPRPLATGANTFQWVPPYRARGLALSITAARIRADELEALRRGITGSLTISLATSEGASQPLWEYLFTLVPGDPVPFTTVELRVDTPQGVAPGMEMGRRYDVVCTLRPDGAGQATARAMHASEFHARTAYNITVVLDGALPPLELRIAYSRPPRGLLDGTLLGRFRNWLIRR